MRNLWLVVLLGCGSSSTGVLEPVDSDSPLVDIDRYDPEHLTLIKGMIEEQDWYELTHEQPNTFYELLLGPDCFDGPRASDYTWFPGQLNVDGEIVEEVGFRKKGFLGSMSWTRPSLKVDSDRFVEGQELMDGTENLTLNNNNQDPSRLNTCLSYMVFRAAGVPASLCSHAAVEINQNALGVFSNVQPIKKQFLEQNFGNSDGDLYEGTVSDFNEDWLVTFEVKSDGSTLAPLEELAEVLETDDNSLIADLEAVLDLDGFITEWAVENLIGHWDGYAGNRNNYYVYHDSSDGLLKVIPWGPDAAFEGSDTEPFAAFSTLTMRLWNNPEGRSRYLVESQRILDDVWTEDLLLEEVDRVESLITPYLLDPQQTGEWMDGVRAYIETRRQIVQEFIDDPYESPFFEHPKECVPAIGSLTATFSTKWDTMDVENVFASFPSSMDGDIYGLELYSDFVGAQAGIGEDGEPQLLILGIDESFSYLTVVLLYIPEDLMAGTYPVDIVALPGFTYSIDLTKPMAQPFNYGFMGGDITFDEVGFSSGDAISGDLSVILMPPFF